MGCCNKVKCYSKRTLPGQKESSKIRDPHFVASKKSHSRTKFDKNLERIFQNSLYFPFTFKSMCAHRWDKTVALMYSFCVIGSWQCSTQYYFYPSLTLFWPFLTRWLLFFMFEALRKWQRICVRILMQCRVHGNTRILHQDSIMKTDLSQLLSESSLTLFLFEPDGDKIW